MEQWWKYTDRKIKKDTEESLYKSQYVHYKSHMDCLGSEHRSPR
jgi:hypothetical protein